MPLQIQLFKHSPFLIIEALRSIQSHEIVRRALENVYLGSADIVGINRILIAIINYYR